MINYQLDFLLFNLALGFYNTGIIFAHEIDIFRSWKFIDKKDFHEVQLAHWKKLPYWVLSPAGLALVDAFVPFLFHPNDSPGWAIYGVLVCQILATLLTAIFWGRWQGRLADDDLGPKSPYLDKILKTHWIRTLLISLSAIIFFLWTLTVVS
jgi:hypothetical protein